MGISTGIFAFAAITCLLSVNSTAADVVGEGHRDAFRLVLSFTEAAHIKHT